MTHYETNDEEFERLLLGRQATDASGIDETAQFVHDVRDFCLPHGQIDKQEQHLGAIRHALSNPAPPLASVAPGPVAAPASLVAARAARAAKASTAKYLTGFGTKAAAIAVAAVISTGGLAAAGALPQPIQSALSDAAGSLGIDLPNPSAAGQGLVPEAVQVAPEKSDQPVTEAVEVPEVQAPVIGTAALDEQQIIAGSQQVIGIADSVVHSTQDAIGAAQQCIDDVTVQLQSLAGQVAGATGAALQNLVGTASALGDQARACAAQAAQAGQSGVEQATAAGVEADRLAGLLSGSAAAPSLLGATQQAQQAASSAVQSANDALSLADSLTATAGQLASGITNAAGQAADSPIPVPTTSDDSPKTGELPEVPGLGLIDQLVGSLLPGPQN